MTSLARTCSSPVCRAQVLPLLAQLGSLISGSGDLKKTLGILLQIMERHMGVVRGMVTLYHRRTGRIFIHESLGLTDEEEARGIYHLGEGITGKVVELGRLIVVRDIRHEPAFLNRTRSRDTDEDLSFVCVPIVRGKKVLGTISVERLFDTPQQLEQDVELLSIVAGMVAQEVELFLIENEEQGRLEEENRRLREELRERYHPSNIIGDSPAMRTVYNLVDKVSKTRATVLILGESGVGKELVASAIHYASQGKDGPFVRFNCAALPEALAESELFGHEKGSFTGAVETRKGRFEEAHGGTIFLDEVGELTLALQAKLLRLFQERSFERVGGNKTINVDLRILAATNRNLEAMVAEGKFREDLFYRLNVFPITIPPLRDRGNDVLSLADHFLARASRSVGKTILGISTPALNLLMAHPWPGNVRELENCIERAVILTDEEFVHAHHLPPSLHASEARTPAAAESPVQGLPEGTTLEDHLGSIEKAFLVRTLEETRGNMAEAARRLGLTKRMMLLRMDKFALDYQVFRKLPAEVSPFRK
jgi:Nif-specific regulatory protein